MIISSVLIIFFGTCINITMGDKSLIGGASRGDYYSSHSPSPSYSHPPSYGSSSHGGHGGLQSFFDIALTGLAFLSFGMFLLNLLLNALFGGGYIVTGTVLPTGTGNGIITMTSTSTNTPTSTSTMMTSTGTGAVGREEHVNRKRVRGPGKSGRVKRNILEFSLDPVTSTDIIARMVLKSIDAMVKEHECVQKVFCDGNKEAKIIGKGFQYLMPAYSLSASYIGHKLGLHRNMSEHMSSILHGIDESNCQTKFPQC